jgi:hypothetical protein
MGLRTTLRLTLEHVGHTVIEARDAKAAGETTRDGVIDFTDDVVRFVSRPFCPSMPRAPCHRPEARGDDAGV